jgi:hypothetical protein
MMVSSSFIRDQGVVSRLDEQASLLREHAEKAVEGLFPARDRYIRDADTHLSFYLDTWQRSGSKGRTQAASWAADQIDPRVFRVLKSRGTRRRDHDFKAFLLHVGSLSRKRNTAQFLSSLWPISPVGELGDIAESERATRADLRPRQCEGRSRAPSSGRGHGGSSSGNGGGRGGGDPGGSDGGPSGSDPDGPRRHRPYFAIALVLATLFSSVPGALVTAALTERGPVKSPPRKAHRQGPSQSRTNHHGMNLRRIDGNRE